MIDAMGLLKTNQNISGEESIRNNEDILAISNKIRKKERLP